MVAGRRAIVAGPVVAGVRRDLSACEGIGAAEEGQERASGAATGSRRHGVPSVRVWRAFGVAMRMPFASRRWRRESKRDIAQRMFPKIGEQRIHLPGGVIQRL